MHLINDVPAIDLMLQKARMRYVAAVIGSLNDFTMVDVRKLNNIKPNPLAKMKTKIHLCSFRSRSDRVI